MSVKNWHRRFAKAAAFGGAIVLSSAGVANAEEVLDFDAADTGLGTNDNFAGSGYGNGLATTPDVSIIWGDGMQMYTAWDGRGDVGQVDFNNFNPITIDFNAAGAAKVYVSSFELDEWTGGGNTIMDWELVGTGFSGTWDEFSDANGGNGGRTLITTGMTDADAVDNLTLQFTLNSGFVSYVAVDNITFGQVGAVPEPASASIVGVGLGAMLIRRRKK